MGKAFENGSLSNVNKIIRQCMNTHTQVYIYM